MSLKKSFYGHFLFWSNFTFEVRGTNPKKNCTGLNRSFTVNERRIGKAVSEIFRYRQKIRQTERLTLYYFCKQNFTVFYK